MKVLYSQYVINNILDLIEVLSGDEYIGEYSFAVRYVDDLVDYIDLHIELLPHKKAPHFFAKYGNDLYYFTYKKSSNTTWYVLFEKHPTAYLVRYITNNHYEGQYFNIL